MLFNLSPKVPQYQIPLYEHHRTPNTVISVVNNLIYSKSSVLPMSIIMIRLSYFCWVNLLLIVGLSLLHCLFLGQTPS